MVPRQSLHALLAPAPDPSLLLLAAGRHACSMPRTSWLQCRVQAEGKKQMQITIGRMRDHADLELQYEVERAMQ